MEGTVVLPPISGISQMLAHRVSEASQWMLRHSDILDQATGEPRDQARPNCGEVYAPREPRTYVCDDLPLEPPCRNPVNAAHKLHIVASTPSTCKAIKQSENRNDAYLSSSVKPIMVPMSSCQ